MANKKINDFDLTNLPIEAQDNTITAEDFKPMVVDKLSHEQKFQTKPTTFFKDSMKRFAKNKSSVVAAGILGVLVALSFVVPLFEQDLNPKMTSYANYLEPKLFNAGTGWWDGTKSYTDVPAYYDEEGNLLPDPTSFRKNAIIGEVKDEGEKTRNSANKYAYGGAIKLTVNDTNASGEYGYLLTNRFVQFAHVGNKTYVEKDKIVELDVTTNEFDVTFEVANNEYVGEEFAENIYHEFDFLFAYEIGKDQIIVPLVEGISAETTSYTINNVSSKIASKVSDTTTFKNPRFGFGIKVPEANQEYTLLIKSLHFNHAEGAMSDANLVECFENVSFKDGNEALVRENEIYYYTDIQYNNRSKFINPAGWSSNCSMSMFQAKFKSCSFVYDTYEAKLGLRTEYALPSSSLKEYASKRWIKIDEFGMDLIEGTLPIEILDSYHCPIVANESGVYKIRNYDEDTDTYEIICNVQLHKIYGYYEMPRYIFGTDTSGHNMNKYVFEGLRNSLLLGIISSAICFVFGLIWGAICGYFGGITDLVMERFTDILSGIPWIVVMTLCIIKLGQSMLVFGMSLCLTGWIGTAARTRTQFYRFKNREYVFASRTLGASDARLIAKHILPNAMGTIITGAVLMIPSVIFSEATISYLGLGLKGMSSLGVILSDNQKEILTHPYLLFFPSVIIALIMISFNLFGNGLRDAINPSLKGEE